MKVILNTSLLSILILSNSFAKDEFDDDFGGDEVIEIVKVKTPKKEPKLSIFGSIDLSSSYGYRLHHITSTKLSTNVKLEYKINKNNRFKATLKAYKDVSSKVSNDDDIDINEIYLQSTINKKMDFTFGRQIVVWGKSDNIRITDFLNPTDNTKPGMVDIKDLRLGRFMSKVDYSYDKWLFNAILIHENRFSTIAKKNSEYYLGVAPKTPSNKFNSAVAFSANGNFQGQDVSFYLANNYVDNTTYKTNMAGFAYNKVVSSYLFKTEVAYFDNYDNNAIKSKIDSLVGVEYNGIKEGSVSLEIANKDNDIQYSIRFNQSYKNQTLDFTALYSGFGKNLQNGGFFRTWIDYDINDKFKVSLGMIDYFGGDNLKLEKFKNNDRVFTTLQYNF